MKKLGREITFEAELKDTERRKRTVLSRFRHQALQKVQVCSSLGSQAKCAGEPREEEIKREELLHCKMKGLKANLDVADPDSHLEVSTPLLSPLALVFLIISKAFVFGGCSAPLRFFFGFLEPAGKWPQQLQNTVPLCSSGSIFSSASELQKGILAV